MNSQTEIRQAVDDYSAGGSERSRREIRRSWNEPDLLASSLTTTTSARITVAFLSPMCRRANASTLAGLADLF
jgi:hypothetical protein